MRRRILARVVTLTTVVAEIRKVIEIFFLEDSSPLHRLPDCAEAFAIAAGIADGHQVLAFFEQFSC